MHEFAKMLFKRLEEEKSGGYETIRIDKVADIITRLLTAYNNGWIMCDDRMPEKRGWYLAQLKNCTNGNVTIEKVLWKKCKYGTEKFYRKGNNMTVIAWQSLPEPCQLKGEGMIEIVVDETEMHKQTNADRIRAMSDEELATWLSEIVHYWDDGESIINMNGVQISDSKEDILEWLQKRTETHE